jgi:hypothetical protein
MGEDHAALRRRRVAEACEFSHEEFIRQTVEAVPADTLRLVASRDRQQGGDTRHGAVKRGVETRHLRQSGVALAERLDQLDLERQMLRIEGAEPVQFLDHFRGELLRLAIFRAAMYHAVPHSGQCVMPAVFLDPVGQGTHRRIVVRRRHWSRKIVCRV